MKIYTAWEKNILCNILTNGLEKKNDFISRSLERFLMADTHHLVKTILIPQVAELLMKNKGLTEDEALKTIYESPIAALLEDDSMGLYGQSALYIYGLITNEEN